MSADAGVEVEVEEYHPPPSPATSAVSAVSSASASSRTPPVPKLLLSYEPYFKFMKFEESKSADGKVGLNFNQDSRYCQLQLLCALKDLVAITQKVLVDSL